MSCCHGKKCCEPAGYVEPAKSAQSVSRYPPVTKSGRSWASAAAPAHAQFEDPWPPKPKGDGKGFVYEGEHLAACNFPLGGFGAGQVHLQGDGTLQGWHVLNQEDTKGDMMPKPTQNVPACFFAISAAAEGEQPHNYLLATPQNYTYENTGLPSYRESHVSPESVQRLQELPGIRSLTLQGRYPIADVTYDVPGLPVELTLEAMSPMIPGEARRSAFPGAVFTFVAKNQGPKAVTVRLMQAQMNFVGWDGKADAMGKQTAFWGGNVNTPFFAKGLAGLAMSSSQVKADSACFGSLCVAAVVQGDDKEFVILGNGAPEEGISVIGGASTETELWSNFAAGQEVPAAAALPTPPSSPGSSYCGGVVQSFVVPPHASRSVSFILTWHFANRLRSDQLDGWAAHLPAIIGAKYSTWFQDAQAVATALHEESELLLSATRSYRDTVYRSTMPENLIQSAAGRAAILGSPTMFWSEDGIVLGFEGNHCCPLNCSHVYGYGILLERLFPEIAQNMQYSAFVRTWDDANGVTMRFGQGFAIDGALASVIKTYLAVQQGDGSLSWLPNIWPQVKKMMDILLTRFDVDGDGCIRGAQQNTYDSSMFGANTFIGSYYVTALRAAARMAELMGEKELAPKYTARAALSSANYEKICWKEEFGYYVADVTIKDCKFSYGPGCFIDHLCAAGLSFACGLGYMFHQAHEAQARKSITKNNVVHCPPFHDCQAHFFPGDSGHQTCSYPNGKLGDGMRYDTLVSIGWTYPVIAGLLHDRNLEDAAYMNDMQRQRQDGRNRSPWNEPECNTLYSRMLSGWGVYDQACGLQYDSTRGFLAFDPRFNIEEFACFFAADGGWGKYTQLAGSSLSSGTVTITALYGSFSLKQLGIFSFTKPDDCFADLDGTAVGATLAKDVGTVICFASDVAMSKGTVLTVKLRVKTGFELAE